MKNVLFSSGILLILPILITFAYAENSWTVSITPYDGIDKKELFQPLELPISTGDKVTWINNDSTAHKITSGVPQYPDYSGEFFSTDILSPGENSSIFLNYEGIAGYYYMCEIHPWFTGKVFFEDRPDIFQSTKNISYDINNSKTLSINGQVDSDLSTTNYEIVIYDSKNNLIFQKMSSFKSDATFDASIDISNPVWDKDEKYTLKLIYGVPSESTKLLLEIPIKDENNKLKDLENCQELEMKDSFTFQGVHIPNWYRESLCWLDNGFISQKEISESFNFLKKSFQN